MVYVNQKIIEKLNILDIDENVIKIAIQWYYFRKRGLKLYHIIFRRIISFTDIRIKVNHPSSTNKKKRIF